MNTFYKNLAPVYEAMYHNFIDYPEEYDFYSKILKRFEKRNVLEIGSGTGNLAPYFYKNGFDYLGLDYSEAMIELAKQKAPNSKFIHGDMCNFQLANSVDSIISTGRTVSYLLKNKSVNAAFSNFHDHLNPGGILCFDFIDANKFIPAISKGETILHEAIHNDTKYFRKSNWTLNLAFGWDFKWKSLFLKGPNIQDAVNIGEDESIIRTFTLNEIELFLEINGLKIVEFIRRSSYAFPTYVVIAEKLPS